MCNNIIHSGYGLLKGLSSRSQTVKKFPRVITIDQKKQYPTLFFTDVFLFTSLLTIIVLDCRRPLKLRRGGDSPETQKGTVTT